jgi:hypothetical protein
MSIFWYFLGGLVANLLSGAISCVLGLEDGSWPAWLLDGFALSLAFFVIHRIERSRSKNSR